MNIIIDRDNIDKKDDGWKPKFTLLSETDNGVEKMWGTKDGDQIPFSQVSHQHWSNIYWYHRYISENTQGSSFVFDDFVKKAVYLMNVAQKEIDERFDGDILDWIPQYDNEKKWYKNQNTRKVLIEKYSKSRQRHEIILTAVQGIRFNATDYIE